MEFQQLMTPKLCHLICYIIDDNDAVCTAVVARRDSSESFLTCRVPLQPYQQLQLFCCTDQILHF